MSQNTYDGGANLDKTLGISGEINSRYQCNALLGIDRVDDAAWQKRLSDVLNAKVELLKIIPHTLLYAHFLTLLFKKLG